MWESVTENKPVVKASGGSAGPQKRLRKSVLGVGEVYFQHQD